MLNPSSPLAALMSAAARPGIIQWLGTRPARHMALVAPDHIRLDPLTGVIGDHYAGRSGTRQVTLIQAEHLAAIASYLGREQVTPAELRRNVVVAGINLAALKGQRIRIGSAVLEHAGECHPCSRMEAILGVGGYNAVRGHGGIVARVITGGIARLGDAVSRWREE